MSQTEAYSFSGSFIRGETLYGFWNVVLKIISIFNSFLVISFLSVYQFGVYKLILSFVAVVSSFLFDGLNGVVINDIGRFLGENNVSSAKKLFREYAVIKITLGVALAVVVFIGSNTVAQYYGKDIGNYIRLVSFIFIIDVFQTIQATFFTARISFSAVAAPSLIEFSRLVMLVGYGFSYGLTPMSLLVIYVVSQLCALLFSSFHFLKEYRRHFLSVSASKQRLLYKIIVSYGKWPVLKGYVKSITENLRLWLIKFFINTEAVALFSLASGLVSLVQSVFPLNVLTSLIPREIQDKERLRVIFQRGMKYVGVIGLILFLFGFFFFPPLVGLLFPRYQPAISLFRIMLLIIPFYGFSKITGAFLIAFREQKFIFTRFPLTGVINVVLAFSLLPFLGLWGAAIEYVSSYIFTTLLFYWYVVRLQPQLSLRLADFFSFDSYDRKFLENSFYHTLRLIRNYATFSGYGPKSPSPPSSPQT